MKIIVFGSRGWLGNRFLSHFENAIGVPTDITSVEGIRLALHQHAPDVVINCAGVTHSRNIPNIDGCIESPEMKYKTTAVNTTGAMNLAVACANKGVKLVHIGSGCIFNGYDEIFDEQSRPNPCSWYATTKRLGDEYVRIYHRSALILRIRMPISAIPHPRNLLTKLRKADRVIDVVNTVTVVEDFLDFARACIEADVKGIVHAMHPQPLSFYQLMSWFPKWKGKMIPPSEYKTKDGRSNAIVISTRTDLPMQLADTETAVKRALRACYGN